MNADIHNKYFFSVATSWAMEHATPHSLGDSLIAIRAGWMEKDCYLLYPECKTGAFSTQPSFTTYELRSPLHSPTVRYVNNINVSMFECWKSSLCL